jgi:hypothetical protein
MAKGKDGALSGAVAKMPKSRSERIERETRRHRNLGNKKAEVASVALNYGAS